MTLADVYLYILGALGTLWAALGVVGWWLDLRWRRRWRRSELTRSAVVTPPRMVDLTITNPQGRERRRTWVN